MERSGEASYSPCRLIVVPLCCGADLICRFFSRPGANHDFHLQRFDPASFPFMRTEVDRLLGSKITIAWKDWSDRQAGEDFPRLVTLSLKGRCTADPSGVVPLQVGTRIPIASTAISDGRILPFAEVDCERLSALLSPALLRTAKSRRAEILGRAMGRLIAHELYHMLVQARTPYGHRCLERMFAARRSDHRSFRLRHTSSCAIQSAGTPAQAERRSQRMSANRWTSVDNPVE